MGLMDVDSPLISDREYTSQNESFHRYGSCSPIREVDLRTEIRIVLISNIRKSFTAIGLDGCITNQVDQRIGAVNSSNKPLHI